MPKAASREGYRHVGCCIDGSDAAAGPLLEQAARIAERFGARLSIVHAVPTGAGFSGGRTVFSPREPVVDADLVAEARGWLEPVARRRGAGAVVLQGDDPAGAVLAWTSAEGCDLLVAAPRRGGVARAILGSFASRLVRDSPVPLLLVPQGAPR